MKHDKWGRITKVVERIKILELEGGEQKGGIFLI
jgi:hypothetical protein